MVTPTFTETFLALTGLLLVAISICLQILLRRAVNALEEQKAETRLWGNKAQEYYDRCQELEHQLMTGKKS